MVKTMGCPICKKTDFYTTIIPPYKTCLGCNLSYQDPLPPKIFEGPEENQGKGPGSGHLMSNEEKSINEKLTESLYNSFHPDSVLDIGCKYPYFLSKFQKNVRILGIDAINEITKYGKELNVPVLQADFESLDISAYEKKFDLITLIHTFEHFYKPVETLKKIIKCLSDHGVLYLRIPNISVKGIERDFSEHHKKIHPYIYSTEAIYTIAEKSGLEVFKYDHYEGIGQSDFYLRVFKERPNLSVCMIVKNEEKNIIDCLESIKDIADELIIVDTGSTDKTKEIVSKYTSKIYDFKWIDDFSAARNYSLSKATGKYIAWFDADDILENPEDIKDLFKKDFDAFNFNIKYGHDIFCHVRLFKNFRNVTFSGMVHEYPIIDGLSLKSETNINVIHKTEKYCLEDRRQRNLRILEKELKVDPDNSRALFYKANALKELNRYEEAIETYRNYIRGSTWIDEKWMAQKCIGQIYIWKKCYKIAIEEFRKAINIDNRWAESFYYIGECYFYLKEYNECIEWMNRALNKPVPNSSLWKEKHIYGDTPYRYISACYIELNDFDKALEYCEKAVEKNPDDLWLKNRKEYIESKIRGAPKIIECYRQGALGDCLMTTSALQGLKQKYPGCFIRYVTHEHSRQILEGNKYIDELTTKPGNDASLKIYFSYPNKNSPIKDEGYPQKPLSRHLIQIFNECAGVKGNYPMEYTLTDKDEKIGVTLRHDYKKYATLHVKSGWSEYKDWYLDRWEIVVEELFRRGYIVLQIGHNSDPLVCNAVDFRDKTIKEAIIAIKYANFHLGIDSFSNHASAAVKTPAVILFGSTSPIGSGYKQNINLYKSLECQPCYREYEWSKEINELCPYNKKCMDLISVEEVLSSISEISPHFLC